MINIKDSSVLSIIGTFDLMFATTTVSGIYYKQFLTSLIAAVAYLVLVLIASWLLDKFAKRFDVESKPVGSTSATHVVAEEE